MHVNSSEADLACLALNLLGLKGRRRQSTMFSTATPLLEDASLLHSLSRFKTSHKNVQLKIQENIFCTVQALPPVNLSSVNASRRTPALHKSIPLAASTAILLWSNPVNAGFLSGFSGLESIPGPQLPQIDFLTKLNEENQKKYAEFDSRFKSSQVLKELLEKTKLNKEKNRQEILDKYCMRGAEWGVGDCSAQGMTVEERENFISMLKKKAGAE